MSFLKRVFRGGKAKTELFTPPPPPTSEQIALAELALDIEFSDSFVAFLRESRPMQVPLCAQFYCVGDESLGTGNIVAANRRQREERSSSPLPPFLIAFYTDGMGNQVCFDTRQRNKRREHSVVFWDHELEAVENLAASERQSENRETAGVIADSFTAWLNAWRTAD